MANINFVLREKFKKGSSDKVKEQKQKNGRLDKYFNPIETPILMVFGFDRKNRFKCKTDLNIRAKDWDFSKQRMKTNLTGSSEFNKRITTLYKNVTDFYNGLVNENADITFNQVKEKIVEFVKSEQNPDFEDGTGFFDVLQDYIDKNKTNVSPRTIQKYKTLKKSLEGFCADKRKYQNLTFSQIDMNFYDDYRNYLLTEVENPKRKDKEGNNEKGLLNDTVSKYLENLKHFLKWSLERGHHKNREFQRTDFSSRRKPKQDIVTLSMDELKKFYEHDFSADKRLEQVRDLFCFAAFTGQRWGDIANFNKADIVGDSWIFKAEKTGKKTIVPFIGYIAPALQVLKKYNFKLPEISNQKFNDYVKEAAEEAELDRMVSTERMRGRDKLVRTEPLHKHITMHTGRRTCVSLLLNVAKMPIPQVMDITQHTDFKTLRKYINEDPDALRKNLENTFSVVDMKMRVLKKAN
ncbi:site-specific integrase [uncultured Draconibacterium sp.]|uniref:tyrosine-type recombinase/integrase n=1 Tax=uncultured Draconibacterium sp. TaxID=1573823 RepID=UPI0025E34256|nr:site-specific integrase [uncultured Draconibacterium sp.]